MSPRTPSRSLVSFEEIDSSRSSAFGPFHALYEAAFPLEDEREEIEAFDAIIALNRDLSIQAAYGPYREVVSAIRVEPDGPVIGGHVFGIASSEDHRRAGWAASVQGIYSFVRPDRRGQVPMRSLIDYSRTTALRQFGGDGIAAQAPPIFMEVNNPLRMTDEQIVRDRESSGMDPFRRYLFWMRTGFTPLMVDYVQPRLRADADPIRYLDLFCSNDARPGIPAAVVLQHLHAFLSISVLKGADADEDEDFARLRASLANVREVAFVDRCDPGIQAIRARASTARQEAFDAR